MRIRDTLLATVAAVVLATTSAHSQTGFSATLTGGQEVPPVATSGTGAGTFILTGSNLAFSIQFTGLTGAFSASHAHGPAIAGVNAGVIFNWGVAPFLTLNPGNLSGTIVGTWTGLTAAQIADLNAGRIYANIHTAFAPGGELRGQILTDQSVPTRQTSWARIKSLYR